MCNSREASGGGGWVRNVGPGISERVSTFPPVLSRKGREAGDAVIHSWCLRELAGWHTRRPSREDAFAEYRRLNATRSHTFLVTIRDGMVTFADKPPGLPEDGLSEQRSKLYHRFIQQTVIDYCLDLETSFAIDVSDSGYPDGRAPVFSFQKPSGSNAVLFPDIDFLALNFYAQEDTKDLLEYEQKNCSAIFVGSTSGASNTAEVVRNLTSPRLRIAEYFRNNPYVHVHLPLVVQCDNAETEKLLREMGYGDGRRIPWREQFRHKFMLSIDGNGATCSRVALALRSSSVLMKYESPHLLYYFPRLIPWEHYIPITTDAQVEEIVKLEQEKPGFFRFIAEAGKDFAGRYLTKEAVTAYAAGLIRLHSEIFATTVSGVKGHVNPLPGTSGSNDIARFPKVECMAHIQNRGDVYAADGQVLGQPGSGLRIEGLMLTYGRDLQGLSYQVVLQDGRLTDAVSTGSFLGARGLSKAILGFRLNLQPDLKGRIDCFYTATFLDGSRAGPFFSGQICQSPGAAGLESLQIVLRWRSTKQDPSAKTF